MLVGRNKDGMISIFGAAPFSRGNRNRPVSDAYEIEESTYQSTDTDVASTELIDWIFSEVR